LRWILLISLFSVACSAELDPFAEGDRYFAVFGYLDVNADTQFVRVDPARLTPEVREAESPGITVRTEDLFGRNVTSWKDSSVVLDDGTRGTLYYSVYRPAPDRTYQLTVRRDDGAVSTAITRTPRRPSLETRPTQLTFANTIEQDILLGGVKRVPDQIQIRYRVASRYTNEPTDVLLDYGVAGGFEGDSWRVTIRLTRDITQVRNRLSLSVSDTLALHEAAVQIQLLSEDWPAGPRDTYTNVINGFGFFGSTARFEHSWRLTDESVADLGLINRQP
jgi:hypothetical protein